jgi:hypothetical protein
MPRLPANLKQKARIELNEHENKNPEILREFRSLINGILKYANAECHRHRLYEQPALKM